MGLCSLLRNDPLQVTMAVAIFYLSTLTCLAAVDYEQSSSSKSTRFATIKKPAPNGAGFKVAERVGFEPTVSCPTPVFKTGALNQALPSLLKTFHGTSGGTRTLTSKARRILNPVRLPIPPRWHSKYCRPWCLQSKRRLI